jgi:hypothetical protein
MEPGVMPPTSAWWPREADIEQDRLVVLVEHGRADRDVGQMRAAVIGRVQHSRRCPASSCRCARGSRCGPSSRPSSPDAPACVARWRSATAGVEQRAGEVEPLLDVHRIGGVLPSVTPICSAIDMKRLLNTSSSTGSAWCPARVSVNGVGFAALQDQVVEMRSPLRSSRARPRWWPTASTDTASTTRPLPCIRKANRWR